MVGLDSLCQGGDSGWPLNGFRTGAGQLWEEGWGFEPWGGSRKGAWRLSSASSQWFNHPCRHNETPITTLDTKLNGASWLVNSSVCQEGDVSWFHEEITQKPCMPDLLRPSPVRLFIWLVLLICIFSNKTVILRIALSWAVCSVSCSNELLKLKGVVGSPKLYPVNQKCLWPGTPLNSQLAPELRAVLLGIVLLNLWDLR